jgi:hypothetical protein
MRKQLLIMLAAAVIGWTAAMVLHSWAYAADEPVEATAQWLILVQIDPNDGEHTKILGAAADISTQKVFIFDTEWACKTFLDTDERLKIAQKIVNGLAAKFDPPGHVAYRCIEKPRTF